jgi:hypothetical protein
MEEPVAVVVVVVPAVAMYHRGHHSSVTEDPILFELQVEGISRQTTIKIQFRLERTGSDTRERERVRGVSE